MTEAYWPRIVAVLIWASMEALLLRDVIRNSREARRNAINGELELASEILRRDSRMRLFMMLILLLSAYGPHVRETRGMVFWFWTLGMIWTGLTFRDRRKLERLAQERIRREAQA